ncbi:hypothetical protein TAMA11512_19400 [Selenomonas sp. TAMA-11512]|nr:hypothetical protein TAMA11512_19400 [Selenomonas sp. TAMA-11512]
MIELIVVISIIGVLAAIAVPKFMHVREMANTSKIQMDLSTINSAIAMYQTEKGSYPKNIETDLKDYIVDADKLKPPAGTYLLKDGKRGEVTTQRYAITADTKEATLDNHTLAEFGSSEQRAGSASGS